jgi:transcription initiation factor TFIIIB Brf1 subunit/transcription initiation factor TFIIB
MLENRMDIEALWQEFDSQRNTISSIRISDKNTHESNESKELCNECNGTLYTTTSELICCQCGLIQKTFLCENDVSFQSEPIPVKKQMNCKIQKMQEWFMWTNDEKNSYKLMTYTKALCTKLGIHESFFQSICQTVEHVMNVIKKHDGTKRARVKDGIILVCIQYICDQSAVGLARNMGLDIKYISKAERFILELISSKKLQLEKTIVVENKSPFKYINDIVRKHHINIPSHVMEQVKHFIQYCEDNDILLDHTPLSLGASCFYYILQKNQIDCDVKALADICNISAVTILKTYNKLKTKMQ